MRSDLEKEQFIATVKNEFGEDYCNQVEYSLFDIHFMTCNKKKVERIGKLIYDPFRKLFDNISKCETIDDFRAIMKFPSESSEARLSVCKYPERMELEKNKKEFYFKYMYGYISYWKAKKRSEKNG